jgi:hypothetical protein
MSAIDLPHSSASSGYEICKVIRHRKGYCNHQLSSSKGAQADINHRFTHRMGSVKLLNRHVIAFREMRDYCHSEFGNWFSKLSNVVMRRDVDNNSDEDKARAVSCTPYQTYWHCSETWQ